MARAPRHPRAFYTADGRRALRLLPEVAPKGFDVRRTPVTPAIWVFVDFMCLPQYYRTEEEQIYFNRAMFAMHVLYAHACVRVVRLEILTDEAETSGASFH